MSKQKITRTSSFGIAEPRVWPVLGCPVPSVQGSLFLSQEADLCPDSHSEAHRGVAALPRVQIHPLSGCPSWCDPPLRDACIEL